MIAAAHCRVRKDSVRVVEALVTASPEFFKDKTSREIRAYFAYKAKEGSVLKRLEDAKLRQDYEAALKTLDSIPPEVIRFYENRTQEPAMRHDK